MMPIPKFTIGNRFAFFIDVKKKDLYNWRKGFKFASKLNDYEKENHSVYQSIYRFRRST
jgi:hypothetical protein